MQPRHTFYDDNALLDLRFLTAAEAYDLDDDDELPFLPYGIGCLLEVGHTPQRMSFQYAAPTTRCHLGRLIAMHQSWDNFLHTQPDSEEADI